MDTQPVQSPSSVTPPPTPPTPVTPPSQPVAPIKKASHAKLLISLVVVVVLVGSGIFVYQWYMAKTKSNGIYQNAYKVKQTQNKVTPVVSPSPVAPVKSGDATIDIQSETIDSNMTNLESDIKVIDEGLSDQSGNLN